MDSNLPNIDRKFFIDLSNYEIIREVCRGGFGQVFMVKEKSTSKTYAAKTSFFTATDNPNINTEIEILARNTYPSLVQLRGFSPVDFDKHERYTILMEFYSNGSVLAYMKNNKMSNTNKYIYLLGVSISVRYLHNHHICHRDLKPENVLLDDNLYPLLSDFGISKEAADTTTRNIFQTNIGTLNYMAPEMLNDEEYSSRVDSYAYAMIVYHIITEKIPFGVIRRPVKFATDIKNGNRPNIDGIASPDIVNFLQSCWATNPQERFGFDEIVDIITNREFYSYFEGLDVEEVKRYLSIFGDEFEELKVKFNATTETAPSQNVDTPPQPDDDDYHHISREMTEDEVEILTTTLHITREDVLGLYRRAQRTMAAMSPAEYNSKIEFLMGATCRNRSITQAVFEFTNHSFDDSLVILMGEVAES